MTNAPQRPRFVATLTSEKGTERASLNAIDNLDAIEAATTWANRIMPHREIDSGVLRVTRDGVEIGSVQMMRHT
jgi:hypothetical protein